MWKAGNRIIINNDVYTFIKKRPVRDFYIFGSQFRIARISTKKEIKKELTAHCAIEEMGIVVPQIYQSGNYGVWSFITETRYTGESIASELRSRKRSNLKASDIESDILRTMCEITESQLRCSSRGNKVGILSWNEKMRKLCRNSEANCVKDLIENNLDELDRWPSSINHGDLNPENLFHDGIIDFDRAFYGPVGYDAITLLIHPWLFPINNDYEKYREYIYSSDFIRNAYRITTIIFHSVNNSKRILFLLGLLRFAEITMNVKVFPKLYQWREARLHKWIDLYKKDSSLLDIIDEFE